MYAVIRTGGKQYRVIEGDLIDVERLEGDVGEKVSFDQVLFVGGEESRVGSPLVESARVEGTITDQRKGDKVVVFKFKRRKMYRRRRGHRQLLSQVRIDQIQLDGKKGKSRKAEAEQPKADKAPAGKAGKSVKK